MKFFCIATVLLLSMSGAANAQGITLESVPPVVIKTVPVAGTSNVDASTNEIQVTFSKKMADRTWSWSTLSKDSFPQIEGKPKYLKDNKTCVLPVKLEPGKTYAIWINSGKFRNFKDKKGTPAIPYLLVFKTMK